MVLRAGFGVSLLQFLANFLLLLMQSYDKVVARGFPVRITGRLHQPERIYRSFFYKRQFLKACIRETKGICVELNVRKYSYQQMDISFGSVAENGLRRA